MEIRMVVTVLVTILPQDAGAGVTMAAPRFGLQSPSRSSTQAPVKTARAGGADTVSPYSAAMTEE